MDQLPRRWIAFAIFWLLSSSLAAGALAQDAEKPLRDRLIECGASLTEVKETDGFATLLGEKPTSTTVLTEIQFRILPIRIEYLPELQIIMANGPPLRNRAREQLLPYGLTDVDLIAIGKLGTVRVLEIPMAMVTDRGLKEYAGFDKLEKLDLSHNKISDAGIAAIRKAKSLKELRIDMTEATDASVETISKLQNLKILDISGSRISEKVAPLLLELPRLQKVIIHRGQFSDAVIEQIRAKPKGVEIN